MIDLGTVVTGYRIDGIVGRGATAVVYSAIELERVRRVAIKVLVSRLGANAAVRQRFQEAAHVQEGLRHPNILDVFEVGESGREAFIVMPLVTGGTLAELIAGGELTADRALRILGQVADALDFAHGAGVVHGDVKTRNILVDGHDVAYLADFGLAAAVGPAAEAVPSSPGTIAYSAPERLRGGSPTPSGDVYGLACVVFESLTGVVPYPHEWPAAAVGGHLFNAPPRASEVRAELPVSLDVVLARGLAKDPAARPASARDLVDSVDAAFGQLGPRILPPPRREDTTGTELARALLDDTLPDPVPVLPAAAAIEIDEPRPRSARLIALGALTLAVLAAAGFWLGHRGGGVDVRPLERGAIALEAPADWRAVSPPEIPGLELAQPLALGPSAQPTRATLVAGSTRGELPATRRTFVQLDGGVGYRYEGVRAAGGRSVLTFYVLPGPERSAVAVCSARASGVWLRDCESIAKTIRVRRGPVYDPTPSRQFATAYNAAMGVLRTARNSGVKSLGKAATSRMQARAALHVAIAYRATAASIRRASPAPIAEPATQALVRALDRGGVGYTRLTLAARRNDPSAYDTARQIIVEAEAAVRRARQDLLDLGYAG